MNPIQQMVMAMRSGANPRQYIQQQAMQNPQFRQVAKVMEGKTPQQLRQTVENMAKERGTTIEQLAQQMGLPLR